MFSKLFSRGGAVFTRRILPVFFTFCFVMGSALFSACSTGGDGPGLLEGTWGDGYATIEITGGAITYSGSYEGTIVNSPDFSASNGVLIIRFTKYADFAYPPQEPTPTHANVGKYGALYWKELTESSVHMWDAYTSGNPPAHTMFATLAEAETAFTMENVATYTLAGTSPYTRQ